MPQLRQSLEAQWLPGGAPWGRAHWPGRSRCRLTRTGSLTLSPQEPTVRMKVGGQNMTFMLDTGEEYSVVPVSVAPFREKDCNYSWSHKDSGSAPSPKRREQASRNT